VAEDDQPSILQAEISHPQKDAQAEMWEDSAGAGPRLRFLRIPSIFQGRARDAENRALATIPAGQTGRSDDWCRA
jgi:hypothetical protein